MAEVEILHRLYSHAVIDAWSPRGWQNVRLDERDAVGVVPGEMLIELDDLISKTSPSGAGPGWMVRRFASGVDTYACVIVSYADVVVDDGERPGLLTHARLVRVPATQAWLDAAVLVELAEGFAIGDVRAVAPAARLRRYLDLLTTESAVAIREVSIADLDLPRSFLCDALTGLFHAIGRRQQIRVAVPAPEGSLVAELARAWAAVPVALQRTSAWAVGVGDGCPVDVIFATAGKKARDVGSDALVDFVARYVNLLLDSPYDFSAVLRNPEMTAVTKIHDALQKAEPLSVLGDLTLAPAGKSEMQKKKPKDDTPFSPRGELDNDLTTELDRQYRAIETSLRNYIDQRFAAMEARVPQREPAAASPWTWTRVLTLVGMFAITAVLASGVTMLFTRIGKTTGEAKDTAETASTDTVKTETAEKTATTAQPDSEAESRHAAVKEVIAAAETDNTWGGSLLGLAQTNGKLVATEVEQGIKNIPKNDPARKRVEAILPTIKTGGLAGRLDADPPREMRVALLKVIAPAINENELASLKKNSCAKSAYGNDVITYQGEIVLRWLAGERCQ